VYLAVIKIDALATQPQAFHLPHAGAMQYPGNNAIDARLLAQ
jgi:hypothetical protein